MTTPSSPRPLSLLALGCAGLMGLSTLCAIGSVVMLGTGPEVFIVPGNQLTQLQTNRIDELQVLNQGETVVYFYSDAMVDIAAGMVLVTDRAVVLYDEDLAQPLQRARFEDIREGRFYRDTSFGTDGRLVLSTRDGELSLPMSSTHDGDLRFVAEVARQTGLDIPAE